MTKEMAASDRSSMTERMRAAALRGQTASLEMQEAATEMLALANEVEDFAERQEDALIRLRGPAAQEVVKSAAGGDAEEGDSEEEAEKLAHVLEIVGHKAEA